MVGQAGSSKGEQAGWRGAGGTCGSSASASASPHRYSLGVMLSWLMKRRMYECGWLPSSCLLPSASSSFSSRTTDL